MKIIIEGENANFSCLQPGGCLSKPKGAHLLPGLQLQRQLLGRWCWAAIAADLANFYHKRLISQTEVASMVLGFDCNGFNHDTDLTERCNVNYKLDEALSAVQCYSHWSPGKPSFERLQFELSLGQPVCCRINWFKGDAHYVVIYGYNNQTRELYIADPLHNTCQIAYAAFPKKYNETGGVWTETYWTKNQLLTNSH